ncbi:galactose mutarotase-like [Eucalyptus grandis]|uniref:galactose mutarotase-like n=1 Tax=Eucalyptus grandis TaxID=71139 RepID=UPI00192E89D6|nr:galactose mutarotase-like [Eucalyptus grandis]
MPDPDHAAIPISPLLHRCSLCSALRSVLLFFLGSCGEDLGGGRKNERGRARRRKEASAAQAREEEKRKGPNFLLYVNADTIRESFISKCQSDNGLLNFLCYLGGHKGFDKVIWEVADYKKGENPSITFKYHSHDGEEGYPGDVAVTATYTLTSSTTMRLDMEAVPENKATPISLAQHTYWNLAGHDSGNILNHSIQIWANHITPVDQSTIPTGEIMPVKGTAFDFTTEKKIGASIHEVPGLGYDHNYVLDCGEEKSGLKHAAKLKDPSSSRVLDLWTNAPGMQFYTGNYVNGVVGKGDAAYGKHSGVCLETQGFPNAINQPNFPSVIVRPGEKYKHSMLFEFSLE